MDNCSSFFVLVCFWNVTTKKCNTNHNIYHNFDSFLDLCRILDFLATSSWFFFHFAWKWKLLRTARLNTPCYVPPLTPSMCRYVCTLRACVVIVAVWGRDGLVSWPANEQVSVSQLSLGSHSVPLYLCPFVVTCPVSCLRRGSWRLPGHFRVSV